MNLGIQRHTIANDWLALQRPNFTYASDWKLLGVTALITAALGFQNGFGRPTADFPALSMAMACLFLIASWSKGRQLFPRVSDYLAIFVWTVSCAYVVAHQCYVLPSLNLPLWDAQLAAADRLIFGIDHRAMRATVSQSQYLSSILLWAYAYTIPQVLFGFSVLLATNNAERLSDTIYLVLIGGIATIFASALVPVVGPYPYFKLADLGPGYLASFDIGAYVDTYLKLRSGAGSSLQTEQVQGFITFPSFHTVLTLSGLYAVAHIRPLAAISVVMATAVLVSTVPVGGHYAVDVVGGIVIWILLVRRVERRRQRLRSQSVAANTAS